MKDASKTADKYPLPPTLLAAVGAVARDSLEAIQRAADELMLRLNAPIGVVTQVSDDGGGVGVGVLSRIDSVFTVKNVPSAGTLDDAELPRRMAECCSNLRSTAVRLSPTAAQAGSVNCYALLDLSAANAVPRFIKLLTVFRKVEPSIHVTVIVLSGMVADTFDVSSAWEQVLQSLLVELRRVENSQGALAQMVYVLDGRNTNEELLIALDDMELMCARFIIQHGFISYRGHLHRNEMGRASLKQDLSTYTGSFSVRVFDASESQILESLSAYLAVNDLEPLEHEPFTHDDQARVETAVKMLADAAWALPPGSTSGGASDASHRLDPFDQQIADAVALACKRNAAESLRQLSMRLGSLVEQLFVAQKLRTRTAERYASATRRATPQPVHFEFSANAAASDPLEFKLANDVFAPPPSPPRQAMPRRGRKSLLIQVALILLIGAALAWRMLTPVPRPPWMDGTVAAIGIVCTLLLILRVRANSSSKRAAATPPSESTAAAPRRAPAPQPRVSPVASLPRITPIQPGPVSEYLRKVQRLAQLHQRSSANSEAAGPAKELILEVLSTEWKGVLGRNFRQWLASEGSTAGTDPQTELLRRAAEDSNEWAACVLDAVRPGSDHAFSPFQAFTLRLLRRWRDAVGSGQLWRMIEPDASALTSYVRSAMSPYWPVPGSARSQAVVVAAGMNAWPAIAKLSDSVPPEYALASMRWHDGPILVIVRIGGAWMTNEPAASSAA